MNEKKLVPILCGLKNGEVCLNKGGCVFQTADGKCAPAVGADLFPKVKKTFYCVCSSYYDDGRVVANVVDSKEADEKPASDFKAGRRCDVYIDWFDSMSEAEAFARECYKA